MISEETAAVKMFAVNTIEYVRFLEGPQQDYPIWSNIILTPANSSDEAEQRAREYAALQDKDITCDDRPAELLLAGVRAIWEIYDASQVSLTTNECVEVYAFQMQVIAKEQLDAIVDGTEVSVILDGLD